MKKIKQILLKYIDNSPFLSQWKKLFFTFTLPGFEGIPVYDVIHFFFAEIQKDQIPTRARSISYSFFIAFFPGIIFLFTLLPYIPLADFQANLIAVINEVIPDNVVQNFILITIDDLLNKPRAGLLSFASVLTLYFSTQGMVSMIMSFNKSYSIYTKRNFFSLRWLAFKLTLLMFVLFLTSVSLLIVGSQLINIIVLEFNILSFGTIFFFNTLRYAIILLLYFISISTIYYYGPATKKKFKFISLGSSFASLGSIVASIIFSYYVSGLDSYNSIYGFFGSIIMFLGWMYINAFVLLLGFELNASIYYNKHLKVDTTEVK